MSNYTPTPRRLALFVALAALGLLTLRGAIGQEPEIAPEAKQTLDAMGKFYAGLKGFKCQVNIDLTVEQKGRKQSQNLTQKLAAERPNKLFYELDSPQGVAQVVSNGEELSGYVEALQRYATEEAPPTIAALLENPIVATMTGLGNAGSVMQAILSDDPAAKLLEGVQSVEYGGVVELGDNKCHLIKATQEQFDWELWIDAGDQPLVRQFVPDLSKAYAQAAKGNPALAELKVTNVISYTDWEINPDLAEAFAFKAPQDATEFDSLMEMLTGKPAIEPPHELLGKPAPPIELEKLDGGQFDLASLKGKVVILDFWATWCGPCVQAMPIIDKVAQKYKDQGVELFAVNLQETPDDIKPFLEGVKLDVPVVLDTEGEAALAYKAAAIPQTVLIGKDGTVQVVKVGLTANLGESLSNDVEALIAGKDLAAQAVAEYEQKLGEQKKAKAEKETAKPKADKDGKSEE